MLSIKIKTIWFILLSFSLINNLALADDNENLNHYYTQFSRAFDTLDTTTIEKLYAEDACYIPEHQSKDITIGRENIIALYNEFFGKIRSKNATIKVDFRIIDRQLGKNSATDIGYYLIRFYPPEDTGEPMSEFAGKFVNVSNKDQQGEWQLTVETNTPSKPSFYYNATPVPKLYYGDRFTKLTPNEK